MKFVLGALVLLASLFWAAGALASIPTDLEARSRAGILHVCRDREPTQSGYVVCDTQVAGDDSEYTGAECAAVSLPAECTIDFLPRVKLTGTLLLIEDDAADDGFGGIDVATGFVLDLEAHGQRRKLVEIVQGNEIGHWNGFDEAFLVDPTTAVAFSDAAKTAFNFPSDNLLTLGTALSELAQAGYPTVDFTGTIPLVVSMKRVKPKRIVDASEPGDSLASAARFKVVIQFARARP